MNILLESIPAAIAIFIIILFIALLFNLIQKYIIGSEVISDLCAIVIHFFCRIFHFFQKLFKGKKASAK